MTQLDGLNGVDPKQLDPRLLQQRLQVSWETDLFDDERGGGGQRYFGRGLGPRNLLCRPVQEG